MTSRKKQSTPNKKRIHGSATTHILQTMELNFVEIRRLSPRGLWALAPVRALIGTLLVVMKSGSAGSYAPLYMRMLLRQSETLCAKIRANLNMRIKTWVMQCPARIAWVRGIIGEVAIQYWRKNRLLDYALRTYFGDWKRKWPNGFTGKELEKKQIRISNFQHTARPYNWKAFALVKIINVRGFLFGHPVPETSTASKPNWTQPRAARTLKPIRFTPDELSTKTATEHSQNQARSLGNEHTVPQEQRALPLPCIAAPDDPPPETKPP